MKLLAIAFAALAATAAAAPEKESFMKFDGLAAAKNATAAKLSKDGPLGEVWDKVAAWKADYLLKKNATAAALLLKKPKATATPAPTTPAPTTTVATTTPPTDVAGDATGPAVPKPMPAPAGGNAYAVRFVKADLPADVRAQLAAEAADKGMQTVVESGN